MNRNYRVLIVDGEEGDISYFKNSLPTQFDLNIVSESEMSQFKKSILDDIDIVILDSVANSTQMIERVKKDIQRYGGRWVPIIVTTWEPEIDNEILAFGKGVYDYMVKPLVSDLLVEKLMVVTRLLNTKELAHSHARNNDNSMLSDKRITQAGLSQNANHNVAANTPKPKLFVLENNCLEVSALVGIVENEFETILVKNREEMKSILEVDKITPDVILLDIRSGDRDGYETLDYLSTHEYFRNIPLVLSSSDTRSKHVVRGLRAGATDYLTKPFCQSVAARLGNQAKISKLLNQSLSMH